MANLKLKIYDATNGLDFEIPLDSDKNSPFSLSKQLADLTDLTRRFGVQSYNFRLPISKEISENYDFFNQSQHLNNKNVDADKDCLILDGNDEIERGKIRIIDFINTDGFEEVELLFYGSNYDWKEQIKNLTLADLDYVNNSITYTPTTIKNSWNNTVANGNEWVFPLENRGGRKLPTSVHTEDFRPAIFFHSILTLALKSINYTFESDFMDTVHFKKLVITFFGKRFKRFASDSTIVDNKVVVGRPQRGTLVFRQNASSIFFTNPFFIDYGGTNIPTWIDTPLPYTDVNDNFNPTTPLAVHDGNIMQCGKFTAPVKGIYDITFESLLSIGHQIFYNTEDGSGSGKIYIIFFFVKYNSSGVAYNSPFGSSFDNTIVMLELDHQTDYAANIQQPPYSYYIEGGGEGLFVSEKIQIEMNAGDYLVLHSHIRFETDQPLVANGIYFLLVTAGNSRMSFTLNEKITEGQTFNLTDVVDDKIKVLDIINDVSRLFNLYFDTDTTLRKIRIEPRDNYYYDIENAIDYTQYIDVSKPIKTVYNSSFHKRNFIFGYEQDSKDAFVVGRNKEQSNNIAEYKHELPSKFQDGTTEIKTSVLAPTYVGRDNDSLQPIQIAYAPYTARYWNKYSETAPLEMFEDNAPRLLEFVYMWQNDGTTQCRFRFYDEVNDRTLIPAVLPYAPFDGTNYLAFNYFNLYWHNIGVKKGLFETYYGSTISEIISGTKSSLSIWVTQKLWKQFSFRNIIYIDAPVDIKGYWVVEMLDNYQPERSGLVRVDLLKRINYDPQVEGEAVLPDFPPIIGNEKVVADTNPMLFLSTDGNGNTTKIAMTSKDLNGNESTLNA